MMAKNNKICVRTKLKNKYFIGIADILSL